MPGFVPFAGRHPLFLSSAVAGAVLMATPTQAETTPTAPAPTLEPAGTTPKSVSMVEQTVVGAATTAQQIGDTSIRPFNFQASDEDLVDLKRRIKATRWPSRELVADDTQGVRLGTMQKLADYWANNYDWRKAEAYLNKYPQFITNIDGVDIHFIHVKSKHPNALPVIITHGWPGSVLEQLKIIKPLTSERYCINSVSLDFTPNGEPLPDKLSRGAPEGEAWTG